MSSFIKLIANQRKVDVHMKGMRMGMSERREPLWDTLVEKVKCLEVMYMMVMVVRLTGSKALQSWDVRTKTTGIRGMRGREMGARVIEVTGRGAVTWSYQLEAMASLVVRGVATDG